MSVIKTVVSDSRLIDVGDGQSRPCGEDAMRSSLTRRVAIAGLCTSVVVPVSVSAADNPDAELLRLGKLVDELISAHADAEQRSKPNEAAWEEVLRQFGE